MIWEGVAGVIAVGLLGALTTLAYRHPKGYARIHPIINRTNWIAVLLYYVFIFGYGAGVSSMWGFVAIDKFDAAMNSRLGVNWVLYPGIGSSILTAYLSLLRYVPKLTGRDDEYIPEPGILILRAADQRVDENRAVKAASKGTIRAKKKRITPLKQGIRPRARAAPLRAKKTAGLELKSGE